MSKAIARFPSLHSGQGCGIWLGLIGLAFSFLPLQLKGGDSDARYQHGNFQLVANVAQLHEAVLRRACPICAYSLRGQVLAVAPAGTIFFGDESGFEILETSLETSDLYAGQMIQLKGTNYVVPTEIGVSLGRKPVADNDGCHLETEGIGSTYLTSGFYPIEVSWFAQTNPAALSLFYSGPNFSRRPIPDEALFQFDNAQENRRASGVRYQGYEGNWQQLPPFDKMVPITNGVARNFNLNVRTKTNYVGLVFKGILAVKQDGPYTFYLRSSDGGRLFVNNSQTQLQDLGAGEMPLPRKIIPQQQLETNAGDFWAETEGVVSFIGCRDNGMEMEIKAGDDQMRVILLEKSWELPSYLLGSRVRLRGACLSTVNADQKRSADMMVVPSWGFVEILETAPERWLMSRSLKVGEGLMATADTRPIVKLRGRLQGGQSSANTVLEDGTGSLPVRLLTPSLPPSGAEIECLGTWEGTGTNSLLRDAVWREIPEKPADKSETLPVLTTALQVEQLTQEEARQGREVHLKGVVTWVSEAHNAIVLNDSTHGVFVMITPAWAWSPPRVGEVLEINGVTRSRQFAPVVVLRSVNRLGTQAMPPPRTPTLEELIGGSLDCQYVEICGLVSSIKDSHLFLIMPGGNKLDVDFRPMPSGDLSSLLHAVVRIRGVMFAKWDHPNHQVTPDHPLWIGNSTINVEVPAPADPFAADTLRAKQLAQFDARRAAFRRVRVVGEILHGDGLLYYAVDENFGFRFQLAQPQNFEPGDNVEAVGLVQLGGVAPLLCEAVARKISQLPLPPPQPIILAGTNATRDASLVWTEGVLVESKNYDATQVLEMRGSGPRNYFARVALNGQKAGDWQVGSRLKLTGVYASVSQDPPSFELLLNSPADVELLATPPFWTLARLSAVMAILTVIIILVLIWIYQLRKEVKHQVLLLEREIMKKEKVERAHAIEQERARIARDLHDDLGSSLTAINMMSDINARKINPAEPSGQLLRTIAERSRSLVTSLDQMVWTVDPKNDNLSALVEYLASYAEEFLGRAEVACKVEMPVDSFELIVPANVRHNILLSTAEILNNAVKHGKPGRVVLRLTVSSSLLEISVQDDGIGFDSGNKVSGNGLHNIQDRMRLIGGDCRIESAPGEGTLVYLTIPLQK